MGNLLLSRVGDVTEAVLPDATAGMYDHAIADQRVHDRCARPDRAIAADRDIRSDHGRGADHGPRADLGTRSDDGTWIDRDAAFEPGGGMNGGARDDAAGLEQRRRTRDRARTCATR